MATTRDEFLGIVDRAIRLWGDEVIRRVRTDDAWAARVQAKWFEYIASAMQDGSQPAEDQLNADDLGRLLLAAIMDVLDEGEGV